MTSNKTGRDVMKLIGLMGMFIVPPVFYVISTKLGIGDTGSYGRRATRDYLVVMFGGNQSAITNVAWVWVGRAVLALWLVTLVWLIVRR